MRSRWLILENGGGIVFGAFIACLIAGIITALFSKVLKTSVRSPRLQCRGIDDARNFLYLNSPVVWSRSISLAEKPLSRC